VHLYKTEIKIFPITGLFCLEYDLNYFKHLQIYKTQLLLLCLLSVWQLVWWQWWWYIT